MSVSNNIVLVTSEMIAELHKEKESIQNKINNAKGRLSVIEEQLKGALKELNDLGVTPEDAESALLRLSKEIASLYSEAKVLVDDINKLTGGANAG